MSLQMEYLHLQRPIDGIWGNETIEGVQVKLTAMSDSGQYVDIGTTTTSGYYGTFGMTWTPAEEGTYEIVASFEGSEAYGSSSASTFVKVGPASSASVIIEPETETPLISIDLAIVIAVLAACIIGAVAYIGLRRRK